MELSSVKKEARYPPKKQPMGNGLAHDKGCNQVLELDLYNVYSTYIGDHVIK